jgi:hypothetical protein
MISRTRTARAAKLGINQPEWSLRLFPSKHFDKCCVLWIRWIHSVKSLEVCAFRLPGIS